MMVLDVSKDITVNYGQEPDVIQAALHFLMTRCQQNPSVGLALGIVKHLELLVNHPAFLPIGVDHQVYSDLLAEWQTILACWSQEQCAEHYKQASGTLH